MQIITDEYMREILPTARSYTLVILKVTPKRREPGVEKVIWEHGRRNFALRAKGVMPIVCPVNDGGDVAGIGIFTAGLEEDQKDHGRGSGRESGDFRLRGARLPV